MTPADPRAPVVELVGVGRTFGGRDEIVGLHPCDLTVRAGEHIAVTGPSGAGKSTLLNLLGLLDRPSSGEYLLDGNPTGALSERARSKARAGSIGFVFQSFHLLPGRTVLENVLLATLYGRVPRSERLPRAIECIERVGLAHRVQALPATLSGGERQRAAIARAVVASPRVLLADEPTGNLDSVNSAQVLDLFDELHADGLTLIVITHDPIVTARASRALTITDGRLSDAGALV